MKHHPPHGSFPKKALWARLGSAALALLALNAAPLVAGTTTTTDSTDAKELAVAGTGDDIWHRKYLTGDWGGERTKLEDQGVTFGMNNIGDFLGNVTGGGSAGGQHATYFGRQRGSVDIDLKKLADFDGEFFVTGIYQYGRNLSGNYLNVNTLTSSIAGTESLRLDQAWYQQGLFESRVKIKVGQLAAVNDFGSTGFFDILMNDELGYAPNALFPTGQSFSPNGRPGAELSLDLRDITPGLYAKAGVFTPSNGYRDPDDDGVHYSNYFNYGETYAFEVGYQEQKTDYAGLYKIGGNYGRRNTDYTGYTATGTQTFNNDYNIYAEATKSVYHPRLSNGKLDTTKGLDLFVYNIGAPGDRNAYEYEFMTGGRYTGPFSSRPIDKIGFGFIYNRSGGNQDYNTAVNPTGAPLGGETVVELDYQYAVTPWFKIQPDFQAIFNPRGDSARSDILILGVRTIVDF
ncbi:MAG: carbohydrate porin [Verrucomicrobium sp.]|nr:carbohydrate porin [Verrucomicrobium sp.]